MGTPPPAAYIAYPGLNQQQIETLTVLGDRWDSVKKLQQDLAFAHSHRKPMHEVLALLAKTAGKPADFQPRNLNEPQFAQHEKTILREYTSQFEDLLEQAITCSMHQETPMPAREID